MKKMREKTQKRFFISNVLKVIREEINHSCNNSESVIIEFFFSKPSSCKTNGQTGLLLQLLFRIYIPKVGQPTETTSNTRDSRGKVYF